MLVFFHIPKTAGLTFLQILSSHYLENEILDIRDEITFKKNENIAAEKLEKYKVLSGHFPYSFLAKCPADTNCITFLRDPTKRVFSLYNFYKNNRHLDFWKRVDLKYIDLESFLTLSPIESGDAQTRAIINREFSTVEEDVAEAIQRLENNFSFIGITELFDESVLLLAKKMRWRNLIYKRQNTGDYEEKRPDQKLFSEIERLNQRDRAVYNYMETKLRNELYEQPFVFIKALAEYKFLLHDVSIGNQDSLNPEISDGPTLSGFLSLYLDSS